MTRPLRILTIIGARPQIIKAAALSRAVAGPYAGRIHETLLHTGQHYDPGMSQVFHDELGIPEAAVRLAVGSGSHGDTTARMLQGIEQELQRGGHDAVLIYGDTNSTVAGALAAAKLHIPIAHVEAGLRSFDKRMPEEVNRIIADHCSTWLFCPTRTAVDNLVREGFPLDTAKAPTANAPHVIACGDVMFDNSLHFAALADRRSTLLAERGLVGKRARGLTLFEGQVQGVAEGGAARTGQRQQFGMRLFGGGGGFGRRRRGFVVGRGFFHRERIMAVLAAIDLDAGRSPGNGLAASDERATVLAVHPDRVDLAIAPDAAWHFTARQFDGLVAVRAPSEEAAA